MDKIISEMKDHAKNNRRSIKKSLKFEDKHIDMIVSSNPSKFEVILRYEDSETKEFSVLMDGLRKKWSEAASVCFVVEQNKHTGEFHNHEVVLC